MKILVASTGRIITTAYDSGTEEAVGFSFGQWEELDKNSDGTVRYKWKLEDAKGNLKGYFLDEDPLAMTGAKAPSYQAFEFLGFNTVPEDYSEEKYLFIDGAFTINPDWVEPKPTPEERIAELEAALLLTDETAVELYEAQLAQEEVNIAQDAALVEIYEFIENL